MAPRVVVVSLASDFGCQVQMTNFPELLEMLGTIELSYWQLATSGHMPKEYDVAVIEGACTTEEHLELLKKIRATAKTVIAIGACACTGGVPSMSLKAGLEESYRSVYADAEVARDRVEPRPIDAVIPVDFVVLGCPIDPAEFSFVLQRALLGLKDRKQRDTLCAECKVKENPCFYMKQTLCLGLVTTTGCGAFCVNRGRPCTGCRGLAKDANLQAARDIVAKYKLGEEFEEALLVYNSYAQLR